MHVEPQWVNKFLSPLLVKQKLGEPPMTSPLAALIKRVAKLREAGLKACCCTVEFTLW
jgi:hypothetical protein